MPPQEAPMHLPADRVRVAGPHVLLHALQAENVRVPMSAQGQPGFDVSEDMPGTETEKGDE